MLVKGTILIRLIDSSDIDVIAKKLLLPSQAANHYGVNKSWINQIKDDLYMYEIGGRPFVIICKLNENLILRKMNKSKKTTKEGQALLSEIKQLQKEVEQTRADIKARKDSGIKK